MLAFSIARTQSRGCELDMWNDCFWPIAAFHPPLLHTTHYYPPPANNPVNGAISALPLRRAVSGAGHLAALGEVVLSIQRTQLAALAQPL